MQTVTVPLSDQRAYPIWVGQHLFVPDKACDKACGRAAQEAQLPPIAPYVSGKQVVIVTDQNVAPLYLEHARNLFADYTLSHVILPAGEPYKNLDSWNTIQTHLLEQQCDRTVTLVALGGGVIGDMTGFAAATYQRGVSFIQMPTTLLAQVDSSVGGKTGINHPLGKNMIGAFYQPKCVIADTATLSTLESRQLRSGLAEVIKYGLIYDAALLEWLETHLTALIELEPEAMAYAIQRSCEIKAEVVAADEHEQAIRAILNLGHTFGHAIEAATGYQTWLHGEAVAVGMVMAAHLSQTLGWLTPQQVERCQNVIEHAGLPVTPPNEMTPERFLEYMRRDKKVIAGAMRLVLLETLGKACVSADYTESQLNATLEAFCQ
jgi:3-dehydroquinate synthase